MKIRSAIAALLLFLPLAATAEIVAEDAWVRAGPPGARVFGAYVNLHNNSAETRAVTGASSAVFERVELHRTVVKDDVAHMVAQERVEIPANGSVSFMPGSDHLMLIGAKRMLAEGETVTISMTIDDGSTIEIDAPVRRPDSGGGHMH